MRAHGDSNFRVSPLIKQINCDVKFDAIVILETGFHENNTISVSHQNKDQC